jgi:hypothetical protein
MPERSLKLLVNAQKPARSLLDTAEFPQSKNIACPETGGVAANRRVRRFLADDQRPNLWTRLTPLSS